MTDGRAEERIEGEACRLVTIIGLMTKYLLYREVYVDGWFLAWTGEMTGRSRRAGGGGKEEKREEERNTGEEKELSRGERKTRWRERIRTK